MTTGKLKPGDAAPIIDVKSIHGDDVVVPDPESKWVHLQFRRFAGSPICKLHLQSFIQRNQEITEAGIREVVVFHSPDSSLLPYQGKFPFAVIGDPDKKLYRQFGVGRSIFAILGLSADFLIGPDGKINASHYGRHAYDHWEVDEVLALRWRSEGFLGFSFAGILASHRRQLKILESGRHESHHLRRDGHGGAERPARVLARPDGRASPFRRT